MSRSDPCLRSTTGYRVFQFNAAGIGNLSRHGNLSETSIPNKLHGLKATYPKHKVVLEAAVRQMEETVPEKSL